MTTSRINLSRISAFDKDNPTHQLFINQELDDFNKKYEALRQYDYRSESLIAILGCTWFFGSLGTVSACFIASTFLGLSHEFFGRPDLAKAHQEQLNTMYELYQWCLRSYDAKVTDNKYFLEIAKVIVPLMEYEELKKPLTDLQSLSKRFSSLFLESPLHRTQYIEDYKVAASSNSSVFSFFNSKPIQTLGDGSLLEKKSFISKRQRAYADAQFLMYGRSKEEARSVSETASKWLESLKLLTNYGMK